MYFSAKAMLLLAYEKTPSLNTHAEVSIGVRRLKFDMGLYLHPYFIIASSEGSGEHARLALAYADYKCNKAVSTNIPCAGSIVQNTYHKEANLN